METMVNISKVILSGILTFLSMGVVIAGFACGVYLAVDGIRKKTLGEILLGVFFLLIFAPLMILFIARVIEM